MRIVSFKKFCALPPGTVFQYHCRGEYMEMPLFIKGETIGDAEDYFECSVGNLSCDDSYEFADSMDAMETDSSVDVPVDCTTEHRDGLYETSCLYRVWSSGDVERLVSVLKAL